MPGHKLLVKFGCEILEEFVPGTKYSGPECGRHRHGWDRIGGGNSHIDSFISLKFGDDLLDYSPGDQRTYSIVDQQITRAAGIKFQRG